MSPGAPPGRRTGSASLLPPGAVDLRMLRSVDSSSIREPLDHGLDGFDRFCLSLVKVEPHPLAEVRGRVLEFAQCLEDHLNRCDRRGSVVELRPASSASQELRLTTEHDRFRSSGAELRGLLAVVEREDHGGHRQALGQYGRILVEALRAHRADELGAATPRPDAVVAPAPSRRAGQP